MLYQIDIFRAVYEEGGFSKGAKRLGLTQSAVSQQIRTLENELGIALFSKGNRASVTAEGEYLYKEGGRLLALMRDIKSGIKGLTNVIIGEIHFGMIDVAAIELLPPVIEAFRKRYPDVKLDARVRPSGELKKLVGHFDLDFAVAVSEGIDNEFEKIPIYKDSIVAVVREKSKLAEKAELTIQDLKGEPLILYPSTSHSRMLIERSFAEKGIVPTVTMEMHYPNAIVSLVAQGLGVGLVSELSLNQLNLKKLKKIPIVELKGSREISVTYIRDRGLSPQAKAFVEMIRELV